MLKKLGRTRFVQEAIGFILVAYLRLVRRTTRFTCDPPDFLEAMEPRLPVITAMWHGQHFMVHYAWPRGARVAALISRSGDGEINAIVLRRLGVRALRGSGGRRAAQMHAKGGVAATREMLRALDEGMTLCLTADVPKTSRICGQGTVLLAQLSGRPIHPVAVVTSRRFDFDSWDKASMGKPFSRGAMVLGEAIHVAKDADAAALEAARLAVEAGLNEVHARAYAMIGTRDPGAPLASPGAAPPSPGAIA